MPLVVSDIRSDSTSVFPKLSPFRYICSKRVPIDWV